MKFFVFDAIALLSLLPASFAAVKRPEAGRDPLFWLLVGLAVAGPLLAVIDQSEGAWNGSFSVAIWLTITATMALFALIAAITRHGWRLIALVAPYMAVLGISATIWHMVAPAAVPLADTTTAWIKVHIVVSVMTYGLATLAAIAALAAFLQERALKRRRPNPLTRILPSVVDGENLSVALLLAAEVVLGLGLLTGTATLFVETGQLFVADHKTILTILAFIVIGILLFAHHQTGFRGRQAARWVLIGYLLLTMGYPGVKFVTDVLLA